MSEHVLDSGEAIRVDDFLRDLLDDRLDGSASTGSRRGAPVLVDLVFNEGADGIVETPPDVTHDLVFVEGVVALFQPQNHVLNLVEGLRFSAKWKRENEYD